MPWTKIPYYIGLISLFVGVYLDSELCSIVLFVFCFLILEINDWHDNINSRWRDEVKKRLDLIEQRDSFKNKLDKPQKGGFVQ